MLLNTSVTWPASGEIDIQGVDRPARDAQLRHDALRAVHKQLVHRQRPLRNAHAGRHGQPGRLDVENYAYYLIVNLAVGDVRTDAPVGTTILVQLENGSVATAPNLPAGQHSKYAATTTVRNAWQRLKFLLEDRIASAALADAAATALLVAGPQRWRDVARRMGVEQVLAIGRGAKLVATPSLARRLQAR